MRHSGFSRVTARTDNKPVSMGSLTDYAEVLDECMKMGLIARENGLYKSNVTNAKIVALVDRANANVSKQRQEKAMTKAQRMPRLLPRLR
jgi:hypothetical protein